ncbi:hypothetical protein HPB47_025359 [Ixodes persulcatus]|uniref:Uncharacterized protein n=1 Tax=Ixodes persulcatus TaxID=34615 RepID=A0AC60Q401_IXOPE|nr:hypothetical protein HPB47_025359 [Ixodes persulcatus]
MGHLVDVVKATCHDFQIAKSITCGRTKCAAIVKNVLGEESRAELRRDASPRTDASAHLVLQESGHRDRLLAAETILEKLRDPSTRLYLEFLEYVLPLFTNLNKEMQSEDTRIHLLHGKVSGVLKSILEFYIKPEYLEATPLPDVRFKDPSNFLALDEMYLGAKPTATLAGNVHGLEKAQAHNFRLRTGISSCPSCEPEFSATTTVGRHRSRYGREIIEAFAMRHSPQNIGSPSLCLSDADVSFLRPEMRQT